MQTRAARVVRGLVATAIALAVAAASHAAAGGRIGTVGLLLALAFSALVSIALTGRRISRVRVAVSVTLSQAAFHVLLGVGVGYGFVGSSGMGMAPAAAATTTAGMSGGAAMPDSGWMWFAHCVAAVLTAAALILGEKTFWKLGDRVAFTLARLFHAPQSAVSVRRAPAVRVAPQTLSLSDVAARVVRRRGPPAIPAFR